MGKKPTPDRMLEFMNLFDKQIMMCDDRNDLLTLASAMMACSKQIFAANLGASGTRTLFQEIADLLEYDEVIERTTKNAKSKGPKNKGSNL